MSDIMTLVLLKIVKPMKSFVDFFLKNTKTHRIKLFALVDYLIPTAQYQIKLCPLVMIHELQQQTDVLIVIVLFYRFPLNTA
jgi:hypothetical protein